jgi:UDP-N-acetylmuramate dehydrogenase
MLSRLREIPQLKVSENVALSQYTRFQTGGPARAVVHAFTEEALALAVAAIRESREPFALIGAGTNLVASDAGFDGVVLRCDIDEVAIDGTAVRVGAGAVLHYLIDHLIENGLKGLETMTGIPGFVGGAIYGNAGAYGHSIQERVDCVRYFDGETFRELGNSACEFRYRESVFKRNKAWILTSARLRMDFGDPADLRAAAGSILKTRNEKYPPSMRCAGSIFKNLLLADLAESVRERVPPQVIREGKVPSAYFLEQVGAKGMANGPVRVAEYHANLIYNSGGGTAQQIVDLIRVLKDRVRAEYGFDLEEEVQYLP